jgi:hypothetical protein
MAKDIEECVLKFFVRALGSNSFSKRKRGEGGGGEGGGGEE